MKVWLFFNTACLALISSFLYLTIRQVGLILARLGPIGARSSPESGPRVGENLSHYIEKLGLKNPDGKYSLYVFGNDACSICVKLKSTMSDLSKHWAKDANFAMIYDFNENGKPDVNQGNVEFVRSKNIRHELGVQLVPFAVFMDSKGIVLGKGLVNEMSHLESLLELSLKKI